MPTAAEIDDLHATLREAADKAGTYVVDGFVDVGDHPPPVAVLAHEVLLSLVTHVRPRIVYLSRTWFVLEEELAALSESLGLQLENPKKPLKGLLERWKGREGSTYRLAAAVFCDGVLHSALVDVDWLEEFENEVGLLEAEQEDDARDAELQRQAKLQVYVDQLRADPRFIGPRVGRAKRITLAESLFPDLDFTAIRMIVERATSEHWLSSGYA